MIVTPGYLFNIQELNDFIQRFDESITSQLSEGGIIDQRFSGAHILINMLFEKNEKLSQQVATLDDKVRELKEATCFLKAKLRSVSKNQNELLESHLNLKKQVESNVIALNMKIDDLAKDFEKLKI